MDKVFDFNGYRALLKKAIDGSSQKDFAEKAGISYFALSRTLNGEERRPRLSTLEKIAEAAKGRVTLTQLMNACGYTVKTYDENVYGAEAEGTDAITCRALSFKKAVESLSGRANRYESLASFAETAAILSRGDNRYMRFRCSEEKEFGGTGRKGAERHIHIKALWTEDGRDCILAFILFFCKTEKGGYIISDCAFDLETLWDLNNKTAGEYIFEGSEKGDLVISEHEIVLLTKEHVPVQAEMRLLKAIFGEEDK